MVSSVPLQTSHGLRSGDSADSSHIASGPIPNSVLKASEVQEELPKHQPLRHVFVLIHVMVMIITQEF